MYPKQSLIRVKHESQLLAKYADIEPVEHLKIVQDEEDCLLGAEVRPALGSKMLTPETCSRDNQVLSLIHI